MLFDQIGLKHQSLNLAIDNDEFEISDNLYELLRLGVVIAAGVKIRPNAVSQILGLANIHDLARCVFVDIYPGGSRQSFEFFFDRHVLDFNDFPAPTEISLS